MQAHLIETTSTKERMSEGKLPCLAFTPHANGAKVGCFGPFRGDLAGNGDAGLSPLSFQPAE
jgi:hypothetical protein